MKKLIKIKAMLYISFVIILMLGIGILYKSNYEYSTSPPSPKWAKEVLLTEANSNIKLKITKLEKDYAVAFDDNDSMKVMIIDENGGVKKQNSFKTKGGIILEQTLMYDNNVLYLSYLENEKANVYHIQYKLDKELKSLGVTEESGVRSINQCDSDLAIKVSNEKTTITHIKEEKVFSLPISPQLISAIKCEDKYLIAYYLGDKISYVELKNGKMSEPKEMGSFYNKDGSTLKTFSVNTDGKNIYCLMDSDSKGAYGMGILFKYSLEKQESDVEMFSIKGRDVSLFDPIAVPARDEAKYIFSTTKNIRDLDKPQLDVIECSIKNGIVSDTKFISKTNISSYSPAIADDMVIFKDAENSNGKKNIYLTSSNEKFKAKANYIRDEEKKFALGLTGSFLIKGEIKALIQSLYWTLPALMMMSLITILLVDGNKEKKIKKLFIVSYLIMVIIKLFKIREIVYKSKVVMMPYFLQNSTIGLSIMLIISLISMGYGYIKYSENTERVPLAPFMIGVIIDTLLTSVFYAPFIF